MQRAPWAVYCMEEGMTLSMIAYLMCVCFLARPNHCPRSFVCCSRWILRLSRNNLYCATLEANLSLLGHNALNGADIVGTVGEEAVQPPVIVVSNPSSVDSSGHLVRDLMVATPVMQWGTVCAPPATPSQPPAPSTTAAVVSTGPRSPGSPLVDIQLDENEDARLLARSV